MSDEYRIHLIKHALGWPKNYRNHFSTSDSGPDHTEWCAMTKENLAENISVPFQDTSHTFRVTELGKRWLKERL